VNGRIAAFYALALGVSWAVWAPWVISVRGLGGLPSSSYLHLAGSIGPAVAALVVLAWTGGARSLRRLVHQTVTARACKLAALWAILVPSLAFVVVAIGLAAATGKPLRWSRIGVVAEYPALGAVGYGFASLVCYGLGEEIGWRGFLYPALSARHPPLTASLLVVPFWAGWHVPLFFATDSYRAMGIGGAFGWLVSLVSGSVLTSWLYDRAGSSVLPAAVLHAVLDIYFLADIGVPIQSVMGAIVTLAGGAAAVSLARAHHAGGGRVA
jgi:membrane protease YdiL (CAAX protease family)